MCRSVCLCVDFFGHASVARFNTMQRCVQYSEAALESFCSTNTDSVICVTNWLDASAARSLRWRNFSTHRLSTPVLSLSLLRALMSLACRKCSSILRSCIVSCSAQNGITSQNRILDRCFAAVFTVQSLVTVSVVIFKSNGIKYKVNDNIVVWLCMPFATLTVLHSLNCSMELDSRHRHRCFRRRLLLSHTLFACFAFACITQFDVGARYNSPESVYSEIALVTGSYSRCVVVYTPLCWIVFCVTFFCQQFFSFHVFGN